MCNHNEVVENPYLFFLRYAINVKEKNSKGLRTKWASERPLKVFMSFFLWLIISVHGETFYILFNILSKYESVKIYWLSVKFDWLK